MSCQIEGCAREHVARGFCNMHYKRFVRNGDPLVARRLRSKGRDDLGRKQCIHCKEWLAEARYTTNQNCKDGLAPQCRSCNKAWQREYRFGLTAADYAELLRKQDHRCAICKSPDPGPRDWHVDHDHKCCLADRKSYRTCGACVRGLLCHWCNMALGGFKDDPEVLDAAATYLRAWPGRLSIEPERMSIVRGV